MTKEERCLDQRTFDPLSGPKVTPKLLFFFFASLLWCFRPSREARFSTGRAAELFCSTHVREVSQQRRRGHRHHHRDRH